MFLKTEVERYLALKKDQVDYQEDIAAESENVVLSSHDYNNEDMIT